MSVAPAWQLDLRPGDADNSGTLFIVLGGRWCIDQKLPSAGTLLARLPTSARRQNRPERIKNSALPVNERAEAVERHHRKL